MGPTLQRNAFQRSKRIQPIPYPECSYPTCSQETLPNISQTSEDSSSALSYVTEEEEPSSTPCTSRPSKGSACLISPAIPKERVSLPPAKPTTSHRPFWELKYICQGGYGKVYSTKIHLSGSPPSPAAIKLIQLDKHDANDIWQVRGEIEAMKRIRHSPHPFVIDQPDGIEDEDLSWWCGQNATVYMLFNLYYTDLDVVKQYWSQKGGMPREFIKNMAYELVSGLNHIHSLGIIHGDIKPSNIFVDSDGHCRIGDFGGAMVLHTQAPVDKRYFCATFPGFMTPSYQPPETIIPSFGTSYVFSGSADFWSLGVTIWDVVFPQSWAMRKLLNFMNRSDHRSYSERILSLIEEMEQWNTAMKWPPTFVRKFTLGCCEILPQNRLTGRAAARHVEGWSLEDSDIDLKGFLPPHQFTVRCTCSIPPFNEARGTLAEARRNFTKCMHMYNTTPISLPYTRTESEMGLHIVSNPCTLHPDPGSWH